MGMRRLQVYMFDKLAIFEKIYTQLNWVKILQIFVLVAILLGGWMAFENREALYNLVMSDRLSQQPVTKKISKATSQEIDSAVSRYDLVTGIQVVTVDFQKNLRTVMYTYVDSKELGDIYSAYATTALPEYPLFNSDVNNNSRITDLINGGFVCSAYEETLSARILPSTTRYIKTSCGNSIPPFYGKFTGYVVIYLNKVPTRDEVDQIRMLAKNLSAMIYENDFK